MDASTEGMIHLPHSSIVNVHICKIYLDPSESSFFTIIEKAGNSIFLWTAVT